jgi:hypothetical protein
MRINLKIGCEKAANLIVNSYLSLLGLTILSGILLSSYLRYPISESISYQINDAGETCLPKTEGIGAHCFSDFYLPMRLANLDSPWSNSNVPYPPIGLVIFKPFSYINELFPGHTALISYLLLLLITVTGTVIYFVQKLKLSSHVSSVIFLAFLSSAPIITTIDRGNNIFVILPLLFYMSLNLQKENRKKFLIAGIIIVLIKPQFVLLGLFFLILKEWKNLFNWLASACLGLIGSFIFYPKGVVSNFLHWAYHVLLFQEYRPFGEIYPVNISLNSFIESTLKILGLEIERLFVSAAVFILLVVVLIVLSRTVKLRNQLETFLIILMIPVLFVGTSFHYYLIVLLLPLSFMIAQAFDGKIADEYSLRHIVSTKVKAFAVAISLILCLLPWSIPSTLFFETTSTEGMHISASWILARIVLSLTFVLLVFTELRLKRVDLSYEN